MKKYSILVTVLVTIFILLFNNVFGEIKNGYENEINCARESLKNLNALRLNNNISASQKRKLKARIESVVNFISYYELTENLLEQFRTISPDLYNQIDTIRDSKGRFTDVYVKFIPREEAKIMAAGITGIAQAEEDKHTCISEYGERTVSIKIWIFNKALFALSHELGHINYVVPNLASYCKYYRMNYLYRQPHSNCIGHKFNDLSGKNASVFERKFGKDHADYLKQEADRLISPPVLVTDIKRKIQIEMTRAFYPLAGL